MPLELMENLSSGRPTLVGYASCGAKSKTSMTGTVISARQRNLEVCTVWCIYLLVVVRLETTANKVTLFMTSLPANLMYEG